MSEKSAKKNDLSATEYDPWRSIRLLDISMSWSTCLHTLRSYRHRVDLVECLSGISKDETGSKMVDNSHHILNSVHFSSYSSPQLDDISYDGLRSLWIPNEPKPKAAERRYEAMAGDLTLPKDGTSLKDFKLDFNIFPQATKTQWVNLSNKGNKGKACLRRFGKQELHQDMISGFSWPYPARL